MKYKEYIDLILLANYYYISCEKNGEENKAKFAKEYLDDRIKSALKQVKKQVKS